MTVVRRYVFTRFCLFMGEDPTFWDPNPPPGPYPLPPRTIPSSGTTKAGGTHSTEMLFCLEYCDLVRFPFEFVMEKRNLHALKYRLNS